MEKEEEVKKPKGMKNAIKIKIKRKMEGEEGENLPSKVRIVDTWWSDNNLYLLKSNACQQNHKAGFQQYKKTNHTQAPETIEWRALNS